MKRLLLISNSTQHGRGFLDHVEGELREFLGTARRLLFIPFALHDRRAYTDKARDRLAALGNEAPVVGLREGSWLRVEGASTRVGGSAGVRLFRKGRPQEELRPGDELELQ